MLALAQQQERLQNEIGKEEGKTKKLPATQQDVLKLQQDVEINNQLYTSVLNNIQQLRVVRASEIGNVRIVDKAYIHQKPVTIINQCSGLNETLPENWPLKVERNSVNQFIAIFNNLDSFDKLLKESILSREEPFPTM